MMTKTATRELMVPNETITNRIFTVRGIRVMIDRDLAELYGVETKRLNEQVRRNKERFPDRYCFQLTENEKSELVANCDRFESMKHSTSRPFAFCEPGIGMLASVLRSDVAIKISIQIIDSFIAMRKFIAENATIFHRLDKIETKQLEADVKFKQLFDAMQHTEFSPKQGIFYDGQIFDAYTFVADLVRKAKTSLVLVDNYIDDTVLHLFTKRKTGVSFTIYTKTISRQLALDLEKHNAQYEPVVIRLFGAAHDRFLIIDERTLYHIGASLKDLGKKWFAFSKMDSEALILLQRLKELA